MRLFKGILLFFAVSLLFGSALAADSISKTTDANDICVGDEVTYTIDYFSDNSSTIQDTMPNGMSYIGGSANIEPTVIGPFLIWTNMPPGGDTITFELRLDSQQSQVINHVDFFVEAGLLNADAPTVNVLPRIKCECIDDDDDGYGINPNLCDDPNQDCDDIDPDVNPGADEICDNGIDDDCDGLVDMDDPDCVPAILSITPTTQTVDVGDPVTVTIEIADVVALFSYEVTLNFDDSILDYSSQAQGTFLDGLFIQGILDANRIRQIAGSLVPPSDGVSGSGNLFTVTFTADSLGTADLSLSGISMYDSDLDEIINYNLEDATITVNGGCDTDPDCDDGLSCNGEETCQGGVCTEGTAPDCSYLDDSCNTGVCEEGIETYECITQSFEDDTPCDDDLFCNGEETCQVGVCTEGTVPDCDDDNICTEDSCDEGLDSCFNDPVPDYDIGSDCDTGLFGICTVGSNWCAYGYLTCVVDIPPEENPEICDNGQDDDCDGLTDYDDTDCECVPEDTRDCDTELLGVCALGTETCGEGHLWGSCVQDVQPSGEICDNGQDDDCDGLTDYDDTDCECVPEDTRDCDTELLGVCALGTETCGEGHLWGSCVQDVQPSADDNCDNIDDDCDGTPDNYYVPTPTSCGVGVCELDGLLTCVEGSELDTCEPGVPTEPDTELTCGNEQDDDCDGFTDDQDDDCWECVPEDTQACDTELLGICASGTETCGEGHLWGSCVQDVQPSEEICGNGQDDDCDGFTDYNDLDDCEVPPTITLVSPEDGSTIRSGTIIDLDIGDLNGDLDEAWYEASPGTPLPSPFDIDTTGWEEGVHNITVYANDSNGNNASLQLQYTIDDTTPDLTVTVIVPEAATTGSTVTIIDEICTTGTENVSNVTVQVFIDGELFTTYNVSLEGNTCINVSEDWTAVVGTHNITKVVDTNDTIDEFDEENNGDLATITVSTPPDDDDDDNDGGRRRRRGGGTTYTTTGTPVDGVDLLPPPEEEVTPALPEVEEETGETAPEAPAEEEEPTQLETIPIPSPTPLVIAAEDNTWLWLLALIVGGLIVFFVVWRRRRHYLVAREFVDSLDSDGIGALRQLSEEAGIYILGPVPKKAEFLKEAMLKDEDKEKAKDLAKEHDISDEYAQAITLAKLTNATLVTDSSTVMEACQDLGVETTRLAEAEAAA